MDEKRRQEIALFRHSVLGELLSRKLRRGELGKALEELAGKVWTGPDGVPTRFRPKTLEGWYYSYRKHGFDGLVPRPRADRGRMKGISAEIQELILDMKREDPGRSVPLILRELEQAGRIQKGQVSASGVGRLLRREGLSGPKMRLERPARYRWVAASCGELWQGDCLHGPKLFCPEAGRELRVKVFGLLDDKSRMFTGLWAGFHETQEMFLTVLMSAVLRRGIPRALLLDNHGSFTGSDVAIACAKLGIRLIFARPYDGPSKGKIERAWRTLRAHLLDRMDMARVTTLEEINLRLSAWAEGEYNQRPHAGLSGKSPLSVWEEDAEAIRWVEDPAKVEEAFTAYLSRRVKDDSTCQVRGKTYEVPTELRGMRVRVGYHLLHPDRLWVQDGKTRIPLREVDPEGNSGRPRGGVPVAPKRPSTGLNAVEDLLRRITHPHDRKESSHDA